ncbi:MAG: hypothetical protein ABW168_03090 [Sedimenticola sp.]
MERCPICRGRIGENAVCGRCGADLTLPLQAVAQAEMRAHKALCCMAEGDFSMAKQQLQSARLLRNDPLLQVMMEFVSAQRKGGKKDRNFNP